MCIQFMLVHFLSSVNSWLYYVLCIIMMLACSCVCVCVCVYVLATSKVAYNACKCGMFCIKQSIFCLIINGLGKAG